MYHTKEFAEKQLEEGGMVEGLDWYHRLPVKLSASLTNPASRHLAERWWGDLSL